MFQKTKLGFLVILSLIGLVAASPPQVKLIPGTNEVLLTVRNNCDQPLQAIQISVPPERLPAGISVAADASPLDVAAKSQSEGGWRLLITVADSCTPGIYQVPLLLTDQTQRCWNYVLMAELKRIKPDRYELTQNYPNPFNATTQIKYALANDQEQLTQLVIFDQLGRCTKTLVNRKQPAGFYSIVWDGTDDAGTPVASGVYYCKLTSGSFVSSKKLTVLK